MGDNELAELQTLDQAGDLLGTATSSALPASSLEAFKAEIRPSEKKSEPEKIPEREKISGTERTSSETRSWRKPAMIAMPLAGMLLSAILWPVLFGSNDSGELVQEKLDPASRNSSGSETEMNASESAGGAMKLLAQALDFVDRDPDQAAELFTLARNQQPRLATPKHQTHEAHLGAIERIWHEPKKGLNISIGYDSEPLVWKSTVDDAGSNSIDDQRLLQLSKLQGLKSDIFYREAIALSDGGGIFVAAAGNTLCGWDTTSLTNNGDATPPLFERKTQGSEIVAVAIHPTQPNWVVAASDANQILCFSVPEAELGRSISAGSPQPLKIDTLSIVDQIVFDPSGQWLATKNSDGTAISYRWEDVLNLRVKAFEPPSYRISAAGGDVRKLFTMLWALNQQLEPAAVVARQGSVTAWSIGQIQQKRSSVEVHSKPIDAILETTSVQERSSGSVVVASVASDGKLCFSDLSGNGRLLTSIQISEAPIACLDSTSDGHWIAAGTYDAKVVLVRRDKEQLRAAEFDLGPTIQVESICIDEIGNRLLAGDDQGAIHAWNLGHCKLVTLLNDFKLESQPDAPRTNTLASRKILLGRKTKSLPTALLNAF